MIAWDNSAPSIPLPTHETRKLATEAKRAMAVHGTLKHVLAAEGIRAGSPDSNEGLIGLNIPRAGATAGTLHRKLVELVQPKGNALGWIGYEVAEDVKLPYLSVYFYSTPKTAPKVRQRLIAVKGLGRLVNPAANFFTRAGACARGMAGRRR